MGVRDDLRLAIDGLTDEQAADVLAMVRRLRAVAAWDAAPPDDEEETEEERSLLAEARAEVAAGHTIPWDQIRAKLHEHDG